MANGWVPEEDWRTIVRYSPIVSVDLLVRVDDGLVLGKRQNEPAAGFWFIPGGRVKKGETREEAVHRIAREELGTNVDIVESLGAFEHFYDTSDVKDINEKHYLANGYVVDAKSGDFDGDGQHVELRIFHDSPEPLHQYIRKYIDASDTLSVWQ